jgi:hypothetical protein
MLIENPFAPLGFLGDGTAVYPLAGAEPQEGELEIEPEDEGVETGDEPEDGADAEPGGDDEKEKLREALRKANGEARKYRLQVREMQAKAAEAAVEEVEEEAAQTGAEVTPAQLKRAVDKAKADATKAAEIKYRKVAVNAAAQSEFVKAGAKAANVAKLVRLLDVDDVDIDAETGEVTGGLAEQIDALKDEFPELFTPAEAAKPAKRAPVKRAAAAPRQEAEPQALSSAEKIAQQLLGTGR